MVGVKDYKLQTLHLIFNITNITFNISPFMVGVKDYKHYI